MNNKEVLAFMIAEKSKWVSIYNGNSKKSDSMKEWMQMHINMYDYTIKLIEREIYNENLKDDLRRSSNLLNAVRLY